KLNELRKRGAPEEEVPPTTEDLLGDIREILRNQTAAAGGPAEGPASEGGPVDRTSLRGTESDCTLVDPTRDREGPASGRRALLTRLVSRCDGRVAYDQCGGFCDR